VSEAVSEARSLLDPIRQLRSNTVPITDAENEMDLSCLADFVALTESVGFSHAARKANDDRQP